MVRRFYIVCFLAMLGCGGSARTVECDDDAPCVRAGMQGQCVMPEGFCAFTDGACTSGLRWDESAGDGLADSCVDDGASGPDAGTPVTNACGGQTVLEGEPGTACGVCDTGTFACSGTNAVRCDGAASLDLLVTPEGTVAASTEFSGSFQAGLAVDADLSTSWFSSGPEAGGQPSVFTWTGAQDDCVTNVTVVGNGGHANSDFRTGFGFGQVTVQVEDAGGTTVFSRVVALPGTPDPDVDVDTGGVRGRRVVLAFTGHESDDCGGFGELTVQAAR